MTRGLSKFNCIGGKMWQFRCIVHNSPCTWPRFGKIPPVVVKVIGPEKICLDSEFNSKSKRKLYPGHCGRYLPLIQILAVGSVLFSAGAFARAGTRCAGWKAGAGRAVIITGKPWRGEFLGDGLRHAWRVQPQLGSLHPADLVAQSGGFLELQIGSGVLH